jgi:acyl-CoA synthetase (AMP-forming)/AMP-acid ligase II
MTNRLEVIETTLAANTLGASAVPLNSDSPPESSATSSVTATQH